MEAPQIEKEGYALGAYGFEGRFISYYHQLRVALTAAPQTLLEVGVGDRVFGDFIRNNTKVTYTSVDIAQDLHPDVVGSVTGLPFADDAFDTVCAFEVLEHLPFEKFDTALREMKRVAAKRIIISLPHFGPMLSFSFKIPFVKEVRCAWKLPFPKTHAFNGQHYWEIGKKGYPASLIRARMAALGTITEEFIPWGSAYHHFYVVKL